MTDLLTRLAEMEQKAEVGPWEFRATKDSGGIQFVVAPNAERCRDNMEFIPADCSHKRNGEFIAAIRNAAPKLIAVARAAKSEALRWNESYCSQADYIERAEAWAHLDAALATLEEGK